MVPIAELRRALDFQHRDTVEFDRAVWNLVQSGTVAVHRHGFPGGLLPEERAQMLSDEQGHVYNGISRRMN